MSLVDGNIHFLKEKLNLLSKKENKTEDLSNTDRNTFKMLPVPCMFSVKLTRAEIPQLSVMKQKSLQGKGFRNMLSKFFWRERCFSEPCCCLKHRGDHRDAGLQVKQQSCPLNKNLKKPRTIVWHCGSRFFLDKKQHSDKHMFFSWFHIEKQKWMLLQNSSYNIWNYCLIMMNLALTGVYSELRINNLTVFC